MNEDAMLLFRHNTFFDPKADSKTIPVKGKKLKDLQNRMRGKILRYRLEARNSLTSKEIEKLG